MKLNLLYGSDELRSDYINVDPLGFEHPNKNWSNLTNLPCYDGEAEEVRAINVLSYYDQAECESILNHWVGKVQLGGRLIFGELNINQITRDLVNGVLTQAQFTDIIYGVRLHRKNCVSLDDIVQFLAQRGFKIIKKHLAGYNYIVEAVRER